MLSLRNRLNLRIRRRSLIRSSETELDLEDKVDEIVKLSGETECPVS